MKKIYLILIALCAIASAQGQSLWTSAEAKYKLSKPLSLFAEGEYRTTDGLSSTARWDLTAGLSYKIADPLKFSAGYTFIRQREATATTRKGNIIPAYWQPKHRFFADLAASARWQRFTFTLRERYQYTYRTEQTVAKYAGDGVTSKADELIEGKGKHVLRSRLGAEYHIRKSNFTPYVTCEFYDRLDQGFSLAKTRYTAGTDYRFSKHHSVDVYYRYINRSSDDDASGHVIGVGYQYKF